MQTIKSTSTLDLTFSDRAGNQFTWKLNNPKSGLTWSTVNSTFQNKIATHLTLYMSKYQSQLASLDYAATVETVVTKNTLE